MQELMARSKLTQLSPRECLKQNVAQRISQGRTMSSASYPPNTPNPNLHHLHQQQQQQRMNIQSNDDIKPNQLMQQQQKQQQNPQIANANLLNQAASSSAPSPLQGNSEF